MCNFLPDNKEQQKELILAKTFVDLILSLLVSYQITSTCNLPNSMSPSQLVNIPHKPFCKSLVAADGAEVQTISNLQFPHFCLSVFQLAYFVLDFSYKYEPSLNSHQHAHSNPLFKDLLVCGLPYMRSKVWPIVGTIQRGF